MHNNNPGPRRGILIGIAGASGSGKTLVAQTLYDALGTEKVVTLGEDSTMSFLQAIFRSYSRARPSSIRFMIITPIPGKRKRGGWDHTKSLSLKAY
jgi:ABC-type dipeptide/oligopeptide/nickel transport system ATPase component